MADFRSHSAINTKPGSALELGYYSRDIDLVELELALADLADDVQPTLFFALMQAIQQFREQYRICTDERELLAALAPNIGDMPLDLEDQALLIGRLQSFADRALGPTNPYRAWYDLGAALGDYAATASGPARHPTKASRVRDTIQALPADYLTSVPVLQYFLDRDRKGHKSETAIEEALRVVMERASFPEDGVSLLAPCRELRRQILEQLKDVDTREPSKPKEKVWYHTDPPPDNRGWRGPIEGQLWELAKKIGKTEKTLRARNRKGTLWIRKVDGQHFQVWFKTPEEHSSAFTRTIAPRPTIDKKGR